MEMVSKPCQVDLSTHPGSFKNLKRKNIQAAKWGTPKKMFKKVNLTIACQSCKYNFISVKFTNLQKNILKLEQLMFF